MSGRRQGPAPAKNAVAADNIPQCPHVHAGKACAFETPRETRRKRSGYRLDKLKRHVETCGNECLPHERVACDECRRLHPEFFRSLEFAARELMGERVGAAGERTPDIGSGNQLTPRRTPKRRQGDNTDRSQPSPYTDPNAKKTPLSSKAWSYSSTSSAAAADSSADELSADEVEEDTDEVDPLVYSASLHILQRLVNVVRKGAKSEKSPALQQVVGIMKVGLKELEREGEPAPTFKSLCRALDISENWYGDRRGWVQRAMDIVTGQLDEDSQSSAVSLEVPDSDDVEGLVKLVLDLDAVRREVPDTRASLFPLEVREKSSLYDNEVLQAVVRFWILNCPPDNTSKKEVKPRRGASHAIQKRSQLRPNEDMHSLYISSVLIEMFPEAAQLLEDKKLNFSRTVMESLAGADALNCDGEPSAVEKYRVTIDLTGNETHTSPTKPPTETDLLEVQLQAVIEEIAEGEINWAAMAFKRDDRWFLSPFDAYAAAQHNVVAFEKKVLKEVSKLLTTGGVAVGKDRFVDLKPFFIELVKVKDFACKLCKKRIEANRFYATVHMNALKEARKERCEKGDECPHFGCELMKDYLNKEENKSLKAHGDEIEKQRPAVELHREEVKRQASEFPKELENLANNEVGLQADFSGFAFGYHHVVTMAEQKEGMQALLGVLWYRDPEGEQDDRGLFPLARKNIVWAGDDKDKNYYPFVRAALEDLVQKLNAYLGVPNGTMKIKFLWSDGGPRHFKTHRSLFLWLVELPLRFREMFVDKHRWIFDPSYHGKSACDALAGLLKILLRRAALRYRATYGTEEFLAFVSGVANCIGTKITVLKTLPNHEFQVDGLTGIKKMHEFVSLVSEDDGKSDDNTRADGKKYAVQLRYTCGAEPLNGPDGKPREDPPPTWFQHYYNPKDPMTDVAEQFRQGYNPVEYPRYCALECVMHGSSSGVTFETVWPLSDGRAWAAHARGEEHKRHLGLARDNPDMQELVRHEGAIDAAAAERRCREVRERQPAQVDDRDDAV